MSAWPPGRRRLTGCRSARRTALPAASAASSAGGMSRIHRHRAIVQRPPGPRCRRLAESYASSDRWSPVRRRTEHTLCGVRTTGGPPGGLACHPTLPRPTWPATEDLYPRWQTGSSRSRRRAARRGPTRGQPVNCLSGSIRRPKEGRARWSIGLKGPQVQPPARRRDRERAQRR
jgi:hypothetical protein